MQTSSRIFRRMDGIQKKNQFDTVQHQQIGHIPRFTSPNDPAPPQAVSPQLYKECVLSRGDYRVRLADSTRQRSKASMLINSMYSWRGYATDALELPQQPSPNSITLEASSGKRLFGTLTLGLDSEDGLLADKLYQHEIDILRSQGRRVCEITKLAFNPKYSSKEALASLFHLAYIYARNIYHATDVLIEVNPRHAAFYEKRLGFKQIGEQRICPRVDAPAVLLHASLDYGAKQISKHAGFRNATEKSLYPYFFSPEEVEGLTNRIKRAS